MQIENLLGRNVYRVQSGDHNNRDGSLIPANGHPDDLVDQYARGVHHRQPLLLFHQEEGRLRNVSTEADPAFARDHAARGLAVGDFNNDGRLDVLIAINN